MKALLASRQLPPPPRYSLGQNFLVNPHVISAVADAVAPDHTSLTVELGVGQGALSRELCRRTAEVTGIEKDCQLVEWAETNGVYPENLTVIVADMLDFDFEALSKRAGMKLNIAGNLPYNISSQIVIRLVDICHLIDRATLMFQKEVADRLYAAPGSKQYGALSVQVGCCFHVRKVMDISPGQFRPRPKVMSTLLSLVSRKSDVEIDDFGLFRTIVRAAFMNRRKKIFNSLRHNLEIDGAILKNCMKYAGISPDIRAETVDINAFVKLSNCLVHQ